MGYLVLISILSIRQSNFVGDAFDLLGVRLLS